MAPLYATNDPGEALCLKTAGIPYHPDKPAENIYEVEWLESRGFASVKEAIAARRHGLRAWFFLSGEDQKTLSKSYRDTWRKISEAGRTGHKLELPKVSLEDFAAICAFVESHRRDVLDMPFKVQAKKSFPDGKGGRNIIGEGAIEKDKARLGL